MAGRVNIGELARLLGISKASVSYALNGQPGVSDQTRARVLELARELQWYPSSSARALSGGRAGVVGVVLAREPEVIGTEPYYMLVISGIESVLIHSEYALLLRMVTAEPGRDLAVYEKWAGEKRVDGVMLFDQRRVDPRIPLVQLLGLPAVLHGVPGPGARIRAVVPDERGDAERVVGHLHALGHRRVAHLTGPLDLLHEERRDELMREVAARRGMLVETVPADYTVDTAARLVAQHLRRRGGPTAWVASNDLMALGAMRAAAAAGVGVPGQVSVLSWDDSMLCEVGAPPMTALDRHPREYGRLSARALLDEIAGVADDGAVPQPSELRVRASTGPAAP
ncbi:LacI family DNA-binding transcriptional regulator [Cellulomonas fengjieae]|uniref:LacI family DNA-binding transcriptional regulator n=1 Tax=Cellulomonas fengjieae TaxID=2819978 RepID=A0ABS3SEZ9_9CELL|nr:LacI family DNA-binding transcriptional regulator [Cellulomonas fengjieae]MBO3084074.1 LacI family DNA-binding transcriptional regulator [Cellulomonas fengjieae]QVI64670.1 LacI family DNA-binding transcriptional regulator [Cellulomonas fengjieae]